jgi:hypothetical protein
MRAGRRENEIDERLLPSLTAEDLKDLGVSLVATDCGKPGDRLCRQARTRAGQPLL